MTMRMLASAGLVLSCLINSACAPVVVGGAAATTVSLAHDRRTAGSVVEDNAIKARVVSALNDDSELERNSHINVSVFNGWVLLSGETPTEAFRSRAGDIARKQEKVRRLYNELTIAAPSSMMTRSSDTWITTKVKSSLVGLDIEGFDPTRVKVVTENGTVFLLGLVYHAEANAAVAAAQKVSGVQRVVKLFEYLD
ncbi:MAG: BON domain-containing protein [Thiogranum sp.]|jgi:osmotically-inducible protein OsmY|nr:BON domain-containing protein [Thiogranum sp.]